MPNPVVSVYLYFKQPNGDNADERDSDERCKTLNRTFRHAKWAQIKPSSKKSGGSQNDLKQTPAVPVLRLPLWASSDLSGIAMHSQPKLLPHASSWFSRSDTASPLLSCHPSACQNRSVLSMESLLVPMLLYALVLHW